MTINLISDIHAMLDVDGDYSVIYAEKQRHTRKKCEKVIEKLVDFAHSDKIDTTFTHTSTDAEKWLYKLSPSSHSEYIKLVDDAAKKFKSIDDFSFSAKRELVDELVGIEHWHFLLGEGGHWEKLYKTKTTLHDVVGWLMKTLNTFDPAKLEPADYLIIAGDIGVLPTEPKILEDIKKKTHGKFKDILYVAGNHSHWWHKIPGISEERPDAVDLSHDYCERVDGDWLFLGCTLWSPIPEQARWRVGRCMNDYRYIPHFTPVDSSKQFEIQSSWLRSKVDANPDKKIVVFTHHQPFKELIEHDVKHYDPWSSDNVGEAYADLDDTLKDLNHNGNIKIWCCGHTHMPFDKEVYGMRVVRNPIGYSDFYVYGFGASECDPKNWYNKVIDLGE